MRIRERSDLSPATGRGQAKHVLRYFGFGSRPFSFSMSLMFIFMPPGITMSPGFWSGLQAPSHFASIVVVDVARRAGRTALAVRGRLDGVGGIEVAGDLGMRGDRHAGDAADGIADIAGRGLLDVLLRADLLAPSARTRCSSPCRWSRRCSAASSCRATASRSRSIFISHRPALRTGSSTAPASADRQQRQQAQAPKPNERSCRVMLRAPG